MREIYLADSALIRLPTPLTPPDPTPSQPSDPDNAAPVRDPVIGRVASLPLLPAVPVLDGKHQNGCRPAASGLHSRQDLLAWSPPTAGHTARTLEVLFVALWTSRLGPHASRSFTLLLRPLGCSGSRACAAALGARPLAGRTGCPDKRCSSLAGCSNKRLLTPRGSGSLALPSGPRAAQGTGVRVPIVYS